MQAPSARNDAADATGTPDRPGPRDDRSSLPALADFIASPSDRRQLLSGEIDATSAWNAAAAAGSFQITCGTYRLDGVLKPVTRDGTVIRGAGRNCVTVLIHSKSGDVLQVGKPGAKTTVGVQDFSLSGIKFYSAVPRGDGAIIRLSSTFNATLDDLTVDGPAYDGITVEGNGETGQAISRISRFHVAGATRACIRLTGRAVDTYLSQGNGADCAESLRIEDASGVWADNIDFYASKGIGIHVTPQASLGQQVLYLWLNAVLSDTSHDVNWQIDGDGLVADLHCVACWASSSATGSGFVLANAYADQIMFLGSTATGNDKHGFDIRAGQNITIGSGSVAEMNSMAGSGRFDGINIGTAADWVTVSGTRSGRGGSLPVRTGHANWQGWGLNAGSGTDNNRHITLMGNQARQNVTGGTQAPTGTNIVNLGNTR